MLGDEDLWVFYGKIQALYRFTLQVEKGDVVALIGANGAGKSTMVNTISGLIPPREGKILFAGERIDGIPPERVVEKGLIQAAEGRELFSALTVFENLMMGPIRSGTQKRSRKT